MIVSGTKLANETSQYGSGKGSGMTVSCFRSVCRRSAAALFNDYLERRGFEEHARRYELMAGMYRRALAALDESQRPPLEAARAVIAEVGHEALAENGDWLLMHRALPIELLQVG